MIATLTIYLSTLMLFGVVGLAMCALLRAGGTPTGPLVVLPLGAVTSVTLLYLLGQLLELGRAGVAVICLALATLLAMATVHRATLLTRVRAPGRWRRAQTYVYARRGDVLAIVAGVLGGTLLLLPVFRLGFPTTIAGTIADGWSYAGMIDWLGGHTLRDHPIADVGHPLEIILSGQIRGGAGIGFEMIATTVKNLLGRESFEVVNAVSATAAPLAVTSWGCLYRALFRKNLGARRSLLLVACTASPLFVLPFSENQAPHFLSLGLWPFAIAMALEWSSAPTLSRLAVVGIAAAGVLGVYTSMLPWLLAGLVAAAAIGAGRRTPQMLRDLSGIGTWTRRFALNVLALVSAGVVLGLFQARQAIRFVANVNADIGVTAPRLPTVDQILLLLGVREQHPFSGPIPVSWASTLVGIAVVSAVFVWASILTRGRIRGGTSLLLISGVVAVITLALVVRFRMTDPFGYGTYKAIVSGGAIIAGCVIIGMIAAAHGRMLVPATAALTVCFLAWSPVSAQLLEVTFADSGQGFRARDQELGRALRALHGDPTILVEGAADGPNAFRLRMMAAYFGNGVANRRVEGLGTTPSYVTSVAGTPNWRPQQPWSIVITNEPQPVATKRSVIWTNGLYTIEAAPELDVTPYGSGWQPVVAGATAWTSGTVEFVLSNRSVSQRSATLSFTATSSGRARTVRLTTNNQALPTIQLPAGPRSVPVRVPVGLGPSSITVVALSVAPGSAEASGPGGGTLQLGLIDLTPA